MQNDPVLSIVLAAVSLAVLVFAWFIARKRDRAGTAALREHFGPEYERVLAAHENHRARAERELKARHKRVEKLHIQPLAAEQCARFGSEWNDAQQHFVDDPRSAVNDADQLVKNVMKERGYPIGDFEQRLADLSVEHANVLSHYRAARAIAQANERGEASTEDLRQAMVHYRELFGDLLQVEAQYGRLSAAHA